MTSRSRSDAPSRRYGEILGSIFSNGSEALEEKKKSSVSQVKRMFRERRQSNSPGRSLSRNTTPERRQNSTSPTRQLNEKGTRSRPPMLFGNNSRPPTPNRRQFQSQRKKVVVDSSATGSTRNTIVAESKGISVRSLRLSQRKGHNRVNFSEDVETFTTRVAKQVSKEMEKTTDRGQKCDETRTPEPNDQVFQMDKERNKETIEANATKINKQSEFLQKAAISEEFPTITGPKASASVSSSPGDTKQLEGIIQVQNQQINDLETCLKKRLHNVEQLTLDLKLSEKNKSKLELDLDIHDLKYSIYEDYRRTMDRQRLDNSCGNEGDEIEIESESCFFSKSNDMFSKLDHLDQLYESSRVEAESRFSILQEEYDRLTSKMSASNIETSNQTSTSINPTLAPDLLENRIKILESEILQYSVDIKRKEEELEKAKSAQNDFSTRREEILLKNYNIENQTLKYKIISLETEIGFTSGHIDDKTRTRRYRALEKNLNGYVAEIMGLEDKLKAKEKIISKLKKRIATQDLGAEKRNDDGCNSWTSSAKWYEQANKGQIETITSSKSLIGVKLPGDELREISGSRNKTGSRKKTNRKGPSMSSSRIAMLRKRLNTLANDHSSVCTDDTQYSNRTAP